MSCPASYFCGRSLLVTTVPPFTKHSQNGPLKVYELSTGFLCDCPCVNSSVGGVASSPDVIGYELGIRVMGSHWPISYVTDSTSASLLLTTALSGGCYHPYLQRR